MGDPNVVSKLFEQYQKISIGHHGKVLSCCRCTVLTASISVLPKFDAKHKEDMFCKTAICSAAYMLCNI